MWFLCGYLGILSSQGPTNSLSCYMFQYVCLSPVSSVTLCVVLLMEISLAFQPLTLCQTLSISEEYAAPPLEASGKRPQSHLLPNFVACLIYYPVSILIFNPRFFAVAPLHP